MSEYHTMVRLYHTDHGEVYPGWTVYNFDTLEEMREFKKKIDGLYAGVEK